MEALHCTSRAEADFAESPRKRLRIDDPLQPIFSSDSREISEESICDRCAKLDFGQESARALISRKAGLVKIGSFDELDHACKLCRFFAAAFRGHRSEGSNLQLSPQYAERMIWSGKPPRKGPKTGTVAWMLTQSKEELKARNGIPASATWIMPCLPSAEQRQVLSGRQLDQNSVDFQHIKGWIEFCEIHHEACRNNIEVDMIPGLRVIDCSTRKIIAASRDCHFAALSYLWGPNSSQVATPRYDELPAIAPKVIEDAVLAAKALAIPFLWVDRYCVDQTNPAEKHTLIQKMDQIYQGAAVTFVDAVGDSPEQGFPGVSTLPRSLQTAVIIGGQRLIAVPDVAKEILSSPWSTRGWTYQEGLLSRRRLIFTRSQVYFQCMGMHCCESVNLPPATFSLNDMGKFYEKADGLRVLPSAGVGQNNREVLGRIGEYLQRRLSFDVDALNAFIGILERFRARDRPLYHFYGVPFEDRRITNEKPVVAGKLDPFHGLHKFPDRGQAEKSFMTWLMWKATVPPTTRFFTIRKEFPTWTWVHWKGIGSIQVDFETFVPVKAIASIKISERQPKRKIHLEDYIARIKKGQGTGTNYIDYLPCLYVTGWFAEVRGRPSNGSALDDAVAMLNDHYKTYNIEDIKLQVLCDAEERKLLAGGSANYYVMWLHVRGDLAAMRNDAALLEGLVILKNGGDDNDAYRRVGTIQWRPRGSTHFWVEGQTAKFGNGFDESKVTYFHCERRTIRLV
ncbi:hypothetical protein JX266_011568 [Neoarthrinium moseri]|nr:hypothetical protein JX266_011568 [Neoarthrinium moseri]